MMELFGGPIRSILWWGDHIALAYFLFLNSAYAVLLLLSIPELWKHWRLAADEHLQRLLATEALPPLSLLVPAHNEEVTVSSSLLSFLTLEYPHLEVVVVNDGSSDDTMDVLLREFDLYQVPPAFTVSVPTQPVRAYYRSRRHSRLLVLDKANGGKADALNAAMNAARHPFVVAVDADTVIEPDALLRLARPFLLEPNVAAVGGTIRVANSCTVEFGRVPSAGRALPGCQVVEYLRAFLFGRMGLNALGSNLIISGAFGLFRKEYLRAIGGYRTGNVTEDMDLVVRLHRYLRENKIQAQLPFVPDPVAWTEVPSSIRVLGRQRERWHRGLIATLWELGDALQPRYGRIGMIAMRSTSSGDAAPAVGSSAHRAGARLASAQSTAVRAAFLAVASAGMLALGDRARGAELPALSDAPRLLQAARLRGHRGARLPAAHGALPAARLLAVLPRRRDVGTDAARRDRPHRLRRRDQITLAS
jgi:glycosyltransferase involved in cell wall biosynthesis